jgi:mRNA interferase MazF
VLVQFPFTSQKAFKKRPAVVVSRAAYNSARPDVVAITSQLHSTNIIGNVTINDWHAVGLLKPSAIKPVFATLEQGMILARLGALGLQDQSSLPSTIAAILG